MVCLVERWFHLDDGVCPLFFDHQEVCDSIGLAVRGTKRMGVKTDN